MNERVSLKTADGVTIVGDYYEGGGDKHVLLLHMMPATRASWVAFANQLVADGYSAFAIDLRGHGESTAGPLGALDYRNFTDLDHQQSIADVQVAIEYLRERGMKEISIAGASIGANLAFVYAASHPEVQSVILLSPGLLYRGVNTEIAASQISDRTKIFLLVSSEDEYAAASVKDLYEKIKSQHKKIEILDGAGHGTTMLERRPEYLAVLASWLSRK